jgi:FkbM family methyltransferase
MPPILAQRLREWVYPAGCAAVDRYAFIERAATGSFLQSSTQDFHGYPFAVHGYYEWRNVALSMAFCGPGDTIVEVGANVGTETVSFADVVSPGGRVVAFEPNPANLKSLQLTARLNPGRTVDLFSDAVAQECGMLQFALPPDAHSTGIGHLTKETSAHLNTIEVNCVTLDSLESRLSRVNMIFMDVEGAEPLVLRGARTLIARHRPPIVLESEPRWLARAGSSPKALISELQALSYIPYKMGRFGVSPIGPADLQRPQNWLCLHASQSKKVALASRYILRCALMPCLPGWNPLCRQPTA